MVSFEHTHMSSKPVFSHRLHPLCEKYVEYRMLSDCCFQGTQ